MMNQMARETLLYLTGLIFNFMWNSKTNKSETIIDPIITDSINKQTDTVQATSVQFVWENMTRIYRIVVHLDRKMVWSSVMEYG